MAEVLRHKYTRSNVITFYWFSRAIAIPFDILLELEDDTYNDLNEIDRSITIYDHQNEELNIETLTAIRNYMNDCKCIHGPEAERAGILGVNDLILKHTWRDCIASTVLQFCLSTYATDYAAILHDENITTLTDRQRGLISKFFVLWKLGFPQLIDIVAAKSYITLDTQKLIDIAIDPDSYTYGRPNVDVALYMYCQQRCPTTKSAR